MSHRNQGSKWCRPEKRERIYRRDRHTCVWCAGALCRNKRLTLDHVIPRVMGGSNKAVNLITAGHKCNSRRRHRSAIDYACDLEEHHLHVLARVIEAMGTELPE